VEEQQLEPTLPEPAAPEAFSPPPAPELVEPVQEKPKPAPTPRKPKAAAEPKAEPYREPVTIRGTGMLNMPVDPLLASARNELSRSNIPGALEAYGKLIKKGRYLDEVIFDLREALDRFPVEVSILQSLGDAYMRSNRLQDALDAYTKAEELLR
jgi:tetratricopeptide (TPR) repeat protein